MAPVSCSICGIKSSNANMLKAHRSLHCDICKKLFMSHLKLKEHMNVEHGTSIENSITDQHEACPICEKSIKKTILKAHINLHCPICAKVFMSTRKLIEHKDTHNNPTPSTSSTNRHCKECNEMIPISSYSSHIRSNQHKENCEAMTINEKLTVRNSAFNGRIEAYSFLNSKEELLMPEEFFNSAKDVVIDQMRECIAKHTLFKSNMELLCDYMKTINDDIIIAPMAHISKMTLVTMADDITEIFTKHAEEIVTKMGEFQERDSGWTLIKINSLEININKVSVIRGSQFIPLPKKISKKGSCINVENRDVYCFKWTLVAALYEGLNMRQRKNCNAYNINIESPIISIGEHILNFEGLEFPLSLKNIKKFEKKNSVSVNVFGFDGTSIVGPYYITIEEKSTHVNMLLLHSDEKYHYVLITDLSK